MRGRRHVLSLVCAGVAVVAAPMALALAGRFPPPRTQGLRPASGYGWLCAGAAPSDCPSGSVPSRLRRPLRLAPRPAGASCPTAVAARVSPSYGIALGPGPAYPVPFRQATLHHGHARSAGGWIYVKVLWIVSAGYRGPVLVRGHQLDGTNWLGFANGVHPLEVREQQTRLTSPTCRTPPGQSAGTRRADPGTPHIAPVSMSPRFC